MVSILAWPSLVLLGEASYSIYILHDPIFFWWTWLVHKQFGLDFPAGIDFLLYSGVVLSIAIASFLFVEKPLRRHFLGRSEPRAG
jgi:peptidoglycan/LPS O-acetylase OafA/YrhL